MPELISHNLALLTAAYTTHGGRIYIGAVMGFVLLLTLLRRSMLLLSVAAFPGTLLHESLHFIVGLLLFGRPTGFSVIPRRLGHGYALGSVRFANVRWYNGCFIGLAPLLILPLALWLLAWRMHGLHGLQVQEIAWAYLLATLIYASLPSWPDIRVAAASSWVLLLATGLYWILTNEGFRVAKL
jgi:hypothetical protein